CSPSPSYRLFTDVNVLDAAAADNPAPRRALALRAALDQAADLYLPADKPRCADSSTAPPHTRHPPNRPLRPSRHPRYPITGGGHLTRWTDVRVRERTALSAAVRVFDHHPPPPAPRDRHR